MNNKVKYVIAVVIGIVALVQVCEFMPRITSTVRHVGGDKFLRGYVSGFWLILALVIAVLSVYILQNAVRLVFAFLYGDELAEDSKPVLILGKITDILSVCYRMVGIFMLGAMGACGIFLPNLEGRNSTTNMICGVVMLIALVAIIFSIRSIVRIVRR